MIINYSSLSPLCPLGGERERRQEVGNAPINGLPEPGCGEVFSLLRWILKNKAHLLFDPLQLRLQSNSPSP